MQDRLVQDFSMKDRVAVVTGGGSGIGQAIGMVFAEAGAKLVLCDLDENGLATTADLIRQAGGAVLTRRVDMSVRAEVDALALAAVSHFGRIDSWVNCAGTVVHRRVLDVTEADIDLQFGVNMKGVYWGCVAAARAMEQTGGGTIVNISSTGADMPGPGISVYSMTKAGVNALTRACALEFGPMGIRVNSVGPGFTLTPLTTVAREADPEKREAMLDHLRKGNPLGIIADPRDQALAALYLASDASRFVTGQTLRPNGGSHM